MCLLYYVQGFSFVSEGENLGGTRQFHLRTRSPIITVLMHLFANSNICVNPGSILMDPFLSVWLLFSVNCLVNSEWVPDITNFTLLGAGYLCSCKFALALFGDVIWNQFDPFGYYF